MANPETFDPSRFSGYKQAHMAKGMVTYKIRLRDGKVGFVTSANAPKLGYGMTITLRDESGNTTAVAGVVEEILEEKPVWR